MNSNDYLQDYSFLKELDNERIKVYYVKIIVLTLDELPIRAIEGRVGAGSSISIAANSAVRRTCSLNFVAEDSDNDLKDIDNLLSMNRKIKILIGFENTINDKYDKIVWFPQGIYVINQISLTHSITGVNVSISCKDKMCLLNGENGGNFPTSVTFNPYDQLYGYMKIDYDSGEIPFPADYNDYTIYGFYSTITKSISYYYHSKDTGLWTEGGEDLINSTVSIETKIYDIIQTVVCNYGGESIDKILISDIPLRIKQLSHYGGSNVLYYNSKNNYYTTNEKYVAEDTRSNTEEASAWQQFSFNEDVGYEYVDFVYPKELTGGMGDNVCTILDTIVSTLGNYEYFYDIDGNFVFQEKKNYLNNSYTPDNYYRLDNGKPMALNSLNNMVVLDSTNYQVDFTGNTESVYTFNEGNGLISSYSNNPSYTNIKNDYHIWGKDDNSNAIHYHLVIKEKPKIENEYKVIFLKNEDGQYNGKIRLALPNEINAMLEYNENQKSLDMSGNASFKYDEESGTYIIDTNYYGQVDKSALQIDGNTIYNYIPDDWRAEIYLQGLTKLQASQRPDIYEQELLDNFNSIYEFCYYNEDNEFIPHGRFKEDVFKPNNLKYYIDYLEPVDSMYDFSVDAINSKIYTYQQDSIKKIYDRDVPNVILIDINDEQRDSLIKECELAGQTYSNIDSALFKNIIPTTVGYSAAEIARQALYQYITYNESISLQSRPIYYLDVNRRITVEDKASKISGDYIISSISMPLDASGSMSITATRAADRL